MKASALKKFIAKRSGYFAIIQKNHAARYYLKRGIMKPGPPGFPFKTFLVKFLNTK